MLDSEVLIKSKESSAVTPPPRYGKMSFCLCLQLLPLAIHADTNVPSYNKQEVCKLTVFRQQHQNLDRLCWARSFPGIKYDCSAKLVSSLYQLHYRKNGSLIQPRKSLNSSPILFTKPSSPNHDHTFSSHQLRQKQLSLQTLDQQRPGKG